MCVKVHILTEVTFLQLICVVNFGVDCKQARESVRLPSLHGQAIVEVRTGGSPVKCIAPLVAFGRTEGSHPSFRYTNKNAPINGGVFVYMAEKEGFEPSIRD